MKVYILTKIIKSRQGEHTSNIENVYGSFAKVTAAMQTMYANELRICTKYGEKVKERQFAGECSITTDNGTIYTFMITSHDVLN